MKNIKLDCLLMDNREIVFCGRSLGRISLEEENKFVDVIKDYNE